MFATAAMLAVACSGSEGAEPTDVDLSALSEFLSSASTSAPVDATEPTVREDGPTDMADLGGGVADLGGGVADLGGGVVDPGEGGAGPGGGVADLGGGVVDPGEGGAGPGGGVADLGGGVVDPGEGGAGPGGGVADPGEGGAGPVGRGAEPSANDPAETATAAEDSQAAGDAGGGAVDVSEPEALPDGPEAALTGELTTDSALDQRRPVAVKVDNGSQRARPQAGLAAADIVYEVLIEGGKTRFLAVFHSEIPGRVGPVRSVRSSDFDLLADLSTPYLVSSGANTTVLAEMRQAARAGTFVDVGGLRTSVPYSRDPSRRPPFNLYFHYDDLVGEDAAALPGGTLDAPVAPLFDYGSSNPAGLADAAGVTVTFHQRSGNVVSHIWDVGVGGWVRIQEGALMTTETDFGITEVAPVNVAVLWMPHGASAAGAASPQARSYGTGDALVLSAGTVHSAVWERTEDRAGFRFSDAAGNPLSLSPGSTWLLLANSSRRYPVAEAATVTASEGARLLADARAAANLAGNVASVS